VGRRALTWEQAEEVRARAEAGDSNADIARDVGLCTTAIRNIVRGDTYREPRQYRTRTRKRPAPANSKLTDWQAAEIIVARQDGEDVPSLADRYSVSRSTVYAVLNGASHGEAAYLLDRVRGVKRKMRHWSPRRGTATRRLSMRQAKNARRLYLSDDSISIGDVARKYGLSTRAMGRLLQNGSYYDADYDSRSAKAKAKRSNSALGRSWTQRSRWRPPLPHVETGTREEFKAKLGAYYEAEFGLPPFGAGGRAIGCVRWFADLLGERAGTMRKRLTGEGGCAPRRRHWVVLNALCEVQRLRAFEKMATREPGDTPGARSFGRFR
jgi:Mor family transcriptional regulator